CCSERASSSNSSTLSSTSSTVALSGASIVAPPLHPPLHRPHAHPHDTPAGQQQQAHCTLQCYCVELCYCRYSASCSAGCAARSCVGLTAPPILAIVAAVHRATVAEGSVPWKTRSKRSFPSLSPPCLA